MKTLTLSTLFVTLAGAAFAHDGHAAAVIEGRFHWLTEADHLALLMLGAALVLVLALPKGRAALRRLIAGADES